uniref:Peptide chain release factor-like protein n=1 Tax=Schlesneria paludicola TaxID=360056 RepID=A0A7C2P189_9PLAN
MDTPLPHPATLPPEQLRGQCELGTARRRGPGGQHRNKTESAVVLKHSATGVEGQASERRSQADNLRVAMKRLRVNVALEVRCLELGESAPTPLWRSRCPKGRIVINPGHDDFAALLAEALDVVAARHGHITSSAEQLGCTSSQLQKFLQLEPRAWQLVNQWRKQYGLPALERAG